MISPFFTDNQVSNFVDAQQSDTEMFAVFFWEMIKNGVFIPPSQFEAWFLSSSLTNLEVDRISVAIDKAMSVVGTKHKK